MIKSKFFPPYVLLFAMVSLLPAVCNGQYTEKQLKRLDKMEIKAAIYEQDVNEPIVLRTLILDRSHPKTLIPGIVLSVVSAGFFLTLANYSNGSPAVEAPLFAIGTMAGIGSLSLHTITIIKRKKRNKLIKQLKN